MASSGKWEVVGKGGKKRVPNDGRKNKVKASDMPKADIVNPLAASKTIYEAFDKSKLHSPLLDIGNGHIIHPVPEEIPAVLAERDVKQFPEVKKPFAGYVSGKKKASAKPQRTEEDLLQEALLKVDLDELTAMLSSLESSFPNNPSIWLRDLAAYLQLKLKGVPQKDPVFEGKPTSYPMCLLSTPLRLFFLNLLKTCSGPTVKLIFQHSLESMVLELSRGSSAYSDQLMIQCIVQCHPQITMTNSKEVLDMLETRKTRTREALALMWCVGQLPHKNLTQALKVWLDVMMPQLGVKQLMKYAVSYLETVLSTCKPADIKEAIVQPKDFFRVMEIAFSPLSPLSGNPSLQRKLLALYPEIKRLSFGPGAVSSGREYFSTLLSLLANDLPLEYQQEVLGCLVFWLESVPECFATWENSYVANLPQSGLLLNHLVEIWDSSTKVLRGKLFQTVETFQTKNDTLLENSKSKAGLDICRKACQGSLYGWGMVAVMEKKTSRSLFPAFSRLFKFVVVVLLLVMAYDVYKHKGYKASKTSQILQQSGLEQAASGGYEYAKDKFSRANSWVQSRYPVYYSTCRLYVDPAVEFCWDKLTFAANFLLEITKPTRDYLNKKIPELLEKIEAEGPMYLGLARDHLKRLWDALWPVIHKYIVIVWDFLSENVPVLLARIQQLLTSLVLTIYDFAPDFFSMVASWFARLGERIMEKLPDVLAVIQEYAIISFNLAVNLVNCLVEWVQGISGSAQVEDVTMAGPMKTAPK